MTPRPILAVAIAAFLAAPIALAHGAVGPREIDQRVVEDFRPGAGDSSGNFGAFSEGAHDLLAVDVREAHDPATGAPALFLRIQFQDGTTALAPHPSLRDVLRFELDSMPHTYTLETTDGIHYAHGFDGLLGPFHIGDGHTIALDAILHHATLGAGPGSVLDNVTMASFADGRVGDIMPGTWHWQGVEMPAIGTSADAGRTWSYTLKGPAPLLDLTPARTTLLPGQHEITLTLTNPLLGESQRIALSAAASSGYHASAAPAEVVLYPGQTASVALTIAPVGPATEGTIVVMATSDLGGVARADVTLSS